MIAKLWLPALIAGVVLPHPALAQGAFNMGSLTQTLSIPTEQKKARDSGSYRAATTRPASRRPPLPTASQRAALSFRRDPVLSERLKKEFIARIDDPSTRTQIEQMWAGNVAPKIVAALKPVGMQYNNIADAQATYIVTAWQAAHRQYTDNPAQFRAVSHQFHESALTVGAQKLSNVEKQELAETLLYQAMFIGAFFKNARTDPETARQLAIYGSRGSNSNFGFDVARLRITPAGIGR